MTSIKTTTLFAFIAVSVILVGLFPFLPLPEESTGFLVFLGRFHPLLLHFPIVLVLLALIAEGLIVYQVKTLKTAIPNLSFLISPLLISALVSVLITAIGGYFLYRSGEYQGDLVRTHLWGGVLLVLTLNGAAFFYWHSKNGEIKREHRLYQACLLAANGLVIFTSHMGGSLTHGKDFLTEHMPSFQTLKPAPVEQKKTEELLVFQDLILPIFEDKCQSCHNEYKLKGGLQMTSFASLQKGGKTEKPLFIANNPSESELYHRITLLDGDDDKMPPQEKAPLNEDEISLIKWWITSGAIEDMMLGTEPPDSITTLLQGFLPKLYQSERLKMRQGEELEELAKELAEFGKDIGLVIELDPEYPGFFGVSMEIPPATINNQTVNNLMPYATLFSKFSLPGAEIDDDALFEIGKMSNLRALYLPNTCIKGEGLIYLKNLSLLESINLSNSCLSNDGILNLIQLPEIKTVYVWGSKADTLMLQALRKNLPEMKILEEEGAYY